MVKEIVGQYYFIPKDGNFVISPSPRLVIDEEVIETILIGESREEERQNIIVPDNWWEEAWKGYVQAVKDKGLDDPRRQPSGELMHKKCEI